MFPVSPTPEAGNDFDITSSGLVFVARDTSIGTIDPFRTEFYYIPLQDFAVRSRPKPQILSIPGFEGSSSQPVFSPNGKSVAFFQKQAHRGEQGRNRLFVISGLDKPVPPIGEMSQMSSRDGWHLSPQSVSWSDDDMNLYVVAKEDGRRKLSKVSYLLSSVSVLPKLVASDCSNFGIQGFNSSASRIITLSPTA